ncbi:PTS sugar transporter subunit IIC [Clostridium sp. Ade.TY]|uniref:PTS sugar transporter subunit IIC n=1 Tax=Clostridium sp. Ade.TY TaxID=1391647 RepID=UPI00040CBD5F|nr:PTS sugar transporter subunit IIC [Clostridium sp. Ade.TY]
MQVLIGTGLLLLVLGLFTLFSYKAPYGMKAMGALAGAACASFLVEAFHSAFFGSILNIEFLKKVGDSNGSLGGVAAAILVPLALGVSPIYSVLIGLSCSSLGILPGFIAGYLMSFVVKFLEKKLPGGLDLIIIIIFAAPLTRLIGELTTPLVNSTLLNIGQVLIASANSNPIVMGIILGGIITVVATAPLSSMALTAMLGLTGAPMAIGALSVFGSSFLNFILFKKMKFGSKKDTISVAIEPLTQADLISANPIPIYITNFIGGSLCGIIIVLMGLTNMSPGTATPIAGFAVMFAYNPAFKVLLTSLFCVIISIFSGYLGYLLFKNYKIHTADEIRKNSLEPEELA